jgi:hypothetical protein
MASPFDSIRESVPWMKDLSDEEVLKKTSDITGMGVQDVAEYFGVPSGRGRNALSAGLRAGWEDVKGLGYSAAGATADVVGATGARDWANRQAAQRGTASELESRPDLDRVEDVYDKPSKWGPYGIYQIGRQGANLAAGIGMGMAVPEVAVPAALSRGAALLPRVLGGGGARAGMTWAEREAALKAGDTFAKQVVGGGAFNEAQSVGSLYQEAVESGRPDASGEAFAKSVPYALAETGPEAMLAGRFLHGSGLKGGIGRRMGISGGIQGVSGATSELTQTALEHSMHPEGIAPGQNASDYLNAGVAGGLVEGVLGGAGGIRRHRAPLDTKQPADLTKRLPDNDDYAAQFGAHFAPEGGLGIRTPEQQSAFTQAQAERDLMEGLNPPPAPAAPVYGADTVGEMERAAGVAPGSFAPVPAAARAAAPAPVKAKAAANVVRDAAAPPVDPAIAQITEVKNQLRDPYIESHLPADHTKTPGQIHQAITRLVGDPQTLDEAAATLKGKIVATLAPAQGKGSRAERDARAEKMIQFYDSIVGTPDAERKTLDQWRDGLKAESAAAAAATALANAKVGQEGKLPGAVTTVDPATLNAAPTPTATPNIAATAAPTPTATPAAAAAAPATTTAPGVPPKPQSPAELEAYRTQITPHLLEGVKPEELQALQLVHGVSQENAGDEEAVQSSLRAAAKESRIAHTTLADRANRALEQISINAAKVDLPVEAAQALLGMQTSLDMADVATPTTAREGQARVVTAPSEEYDPEAGYAREEATLQEEEEAPPERETEGEGEGEVAVEAKPRVEFENKWIDHNGQAIAHADVQDAQEEYEAGRNDDEPTWDRLSPKLQLTWVRGYIAAYDLFPKSKQGPQQQQYLGRVRKGVNEAAAEQGQEPTDETRDADTPAAEDRQGEEGADVAAGAGDSGQAVGDVSGAVPAEAARGVPPAGTQGEKAPVAEKAGAGAEAPAAVAPAAAPAPAVVKRTRKKKEAAPTPSTTPEEQQALETSKERAERKWNEAAGHVAELGRWDSQTPELQAAFTGFDEKDQKLADAMKLKNALAPAVEATQKAVAAKKVTKAKEAAAAKEEEAAPAPPPPTQDQLETGVSKLSEQEKQTLADRYGTKAAEGKRFFTRLAADVEKYVTKGAQAVDKAVRAIIAKVAAGVLSVGIVFNPMVFEQNHVQARPLAYDLPAAITTSVTTVETKDIKAQVPAAARTKMSALAQRVYEAMASQAVASGKAFIIADKPNGMMHAFHADGSVMAQAPALYGKDVGDVEVGNSLAGGKKITPAGTFTLVAETDSDYAGGVVYTLKETKGVGGSIAVHAVWLGEPKEQRARRLASSVPAEHRISYGCINTTNDTFLKDLLPHSSELTGGPIFVLPDDTGKTGTLFPARTETTIAKVTATSQPGNVESNKNTETGRSLPGMPERTRTTQRVAAKRRTSAQLKARVQELHDEANDLQRQAGQLFQEKKYDEGHALNDRGTALHKVANRLSGLIGAQQEIEVLTGRENLSPEKQALAVRLQEQQDQSVAEEEAKIQRSEASLRDESGTRTRKSATTAAHMRSTLKKLFFSDSRLDQKVTIVQSVSDLDPALVKRHKIGASDQGFTDAKGHVTLIADNIDKGSELGIFLHEMGVHVGMEGLIGKANMVDLSKQVLHWSDRNDGSLQSSIAKAAIARVDAAAKAAEARGQQFNMANYMQETIAYFVEEAVAHGVNPTALDSTSELGRWFRRLWAAAKVALRKVGLGRFDSLSAQDVVNLAYGAARIELEGNWHGTAAEFRKFNHKYMGTGEGAQAFGWGTYLAQRPGIAHEYWSKDVDRKGTRGRMYTEYDGKRIYSTEVANDPVNMARFDGARWKAGWTVGDPQEDYQQLIDRAKEQLKEVGLSNSMFKELRDKVDFYTKALAEYKKLDYDKLSYGSEPDVRPTGSLMRADVGVADHEWLDLDKPFSEQSQHVQDVLNKLVPEANPTVGEVAEEYRTVLRGLPDREQATRIMEPIDNWEIHGDKSQSLQSVMKDTLSDGDFKVYSKLRQQVIAQLFTPIRKEMSGTKIYEMLTAKFGSKQAASEALDKAGIKGNRFLDQPSRHVGRDVSLFINGKEFKPTLVTSPHQRAAHVRVIRHNGNVREAIAELKQTDEPDSSEMAYLEALRNKKVELRRPEQGRTRNFVVFNDENIHRAVTQVGASRENLQFSSRAPASDLSFAQKQHMTRVHEFGQRHGLGVMITEDIADLAKLHGLHEVRDYVNTAKAREASRVDYEAPVGKIVEMYDRLPEHERGTGEGSVNKFIHDATLRGDTNGINRLSATGQELVKAVFKHGKDTLALKRKLIEEDVGREYNQRIAEETEDAKKDELRKERNLLLKKFSKLWTMEGTDTYAPLKRFGDYVVSAKSAEYMRAEEAKDQEWINENQTDPAHVQVHFADTQAEADALEAEIKRDLNFKGGETYAAAREADIHNHRDLFRAFPVLQSKLAAEYPVAEGKVSPMARIIRDLYLQALADNAARKNELRRRGITGASHDMMRAFVTQGRADAAHLANLKHNDAVQDAVQAMRKGAERNRTTLRPYLNEMLKRHAASYENHSNSAANRFKRVTSLWMLATNPTYYLQQVAQPWAMSLPVIAGKHGYFRAARALQEGYKALAPVLKGTGLTGSIDWSTAPADVRDMLHTVSRNGAIDVTNSMDQGEWQFVDKGKAGAAWNRVDQKLRGLNTRVEAINRASTAIAAYRLELARNNGDRVAATEYAEAMVRQTHGSYDGSNTPRYMQHPMAQVLTQFRRFQIIQISLIARLAHNALKGSSDIEKGIARRALAYTLLHTGALGGTLGLPGAALITSLVARLFGPSDEPPDFEKEAREAIGDQLISDLLLKGVPAMLGADLSSKFGMGQILSIAPFADFPYDRKSFEKYVFAALGPVVGLGAKAVDGMAQLYAGQLDKGAELLLPTGLGNAMKGFRYGTEGVSLRKGDTVLSKDEIGLADAIMQGLGAPTSTITHQQRLSQTKYEFDTYYHDRAAGLIRDYQQARKDGEPTGDIMTGWQELQEARVRNGYTRQPMSTLIKSAQQQAKSERHTAGGVEFTKANKRFVQEQANL